LRLLNARREGWALNAAGAEPADAAESQEEADKKQAVASTRWGTHRMYRLRS
jgi:hypothetical protein